MEKLLLLMSHSTATILCFVMSWFLQMGLHEGAHAYVADFLGDPTAERAGLKTFDPFRHIRWNDLSSLLFSVVFPILTAVQGYVPMGMAWVPVNPASFRNPERDHALVSAAGPVSNLLLAAVCLLLHHILPLPADPTSLAALPHLFLQTLYLTSIVYGFFNLIPVPPLDGSRVVYWLLPRPGKDFLDDIAPYGFLILIGLFWFGSGSSLFGRAITAVMRIW
ncbi:MAG: site-2 protease family protein [Candidatus Hydrogenedentota bacterium]|nr:MAG: site-2 protease family protein [Candidatus Hydrogenedentota bacterium]